MNEENLSLSRDWRSWDLDLTFKGQRNYIHGSDIYNKIVATFGPYRTLELQFHRMLAMSPVMTLLAPDEEQAGYDAFGLIVIDNTTLRVGIRAGTRDTGDRRYPYDEDGATNGAILAEQIITQKPPFQYTFIEHVIALNKKLLMSRFPERSIKWLFTRLEMNFMPKDIQHLRLTHTKSLGTRLIISEIAVNERDCGRIFFSEQRLVR